jgi:hypothetical protein
VRITDRKKELIINAPVIPDGGPRISMRGSFPDVAL